MIIISSFYTDEIIQIIENEYPNSNTIDLAKKLGISKSALTTKAYRLGINKSDIFMDKVYKNMHKHRKIKQEKSYKNYKLTNIQKNILIGSLLGDGTLSMYGRSTNACYRENTGPRQVEYRQWKLKILDNLDFKTNKNGSIYSPSHPIYTELYEIFYPNNKKIITEAALEMLNHPIGLACLYMDDGSLITSGDNGVNTITITASIPLYTQSFTKEENVMLLEHIKKIFNIPFKLVKTPSGSGYHLKLNKNNHVRDFLDIVRPYVKQIPCMKYKADINSKLNSTKLKYSINNPDKIVRVANKVTINNSYSKEDELKIIQMINDGYNAKEIAIELDRTYYGLYDKIRRMKKEEKI